MKIRPLLNDELQEAMQIKVDCFDEELAGVAPNRLNVKDELKFVTDWLRSAEQYKDIRIILGAFEGDSLMGFVGASIAEESDHKNAVELNYLFVKSAYRGKRVSLKLMREVLQVYLKKQFEYLIVYNHHFAPSNAYYRKLGGSVIRQDIQGIDHLNIDIFLFHLKDFDQQLKNKIEKRYI